MLRDALWRRRQNKRPRLAAILYFSPFLLAAWFIQLFFLSARRRHRFFNAEAQRDLPLVGFEFMFFQAGWEISDLLARLEPTVILPEDEIGR